MPVTQNKTNVQVQPAIKKFVPPIIEKNKQHFFAVRPARDTDKKIVVDFVRSSAEWYKPFLSDKDLREHYVDQGWAEKNFKKRKFFIGHNGREAVGTLSLQFFGDYAYIGYLYLDTKHVGKRYGQKLMNFAVRQAQEKKMKGLVLIAHPEAKWAITAYEKFGFKRIAVSKEEVTRWNDGALKTYYEEGFHLYRYEFSENKKIPPTRH